ncbi:1,4-dihydroxy-6-naphthoate synthase [Candidatus Chlamydia corallus]|uniref:1,4-dihydroxy-6-naphthoate synthase n=1 Tax=Candidatus Chlamydia corallus TaxID=2038470 RepID=UPI000C2FA1F3|nr:menaquinone biosynthesis family protein [Candidatus Chlamydia corallus]
MILTAAFSPCPNDIFLFRSFLEVSRLRPLLNQITVADIQTLNTLALQRRISLMKMSATLFPLVADYYNLMDVGNTLGYNCGPIVLSLDPKGPLNTLATPGEMTTAHALCKLYYPKAQLIPMSYDKILGAILRGNVSGGALIHEERFSYDRQLTIRADFGELWRRKTVFPLPLGCLAIAKYVPPATVDALTTALRQSLISSLKDPLSAAAKALEYSKNKNITVIHKFIGTYINKETFQLSKTGKRALNILWKTNESCQYT